MRKRAHSVGWLLSRTTHVILTFKNMFYRCKSLGSVLRHRLVLVVGPLHGAEVAHTRSTLFKKDWSEAPLSHLYIFARNDSH